MLVDLNSRTGSDVSGTTIHNDSSAAKKWGKRDEEDSVRLYLTDISQYPPLTEDDEVRLAKDIKAGMAARNELERPNGTLTPARKRKLRRTLRKGEESGRTLVQSNLRLVVSIAKKYQASGLPLLDLIQEGNLGLMHAVEKFDWRKGFKFSTYATWWIRQAITRGIANNGRTIRLPVEFLSLSELHDDGNGELGNPDDWGDGETALARAESVTDSVRHKIRSVLASVSHTERLIIEHRLFLNNKTLDELGQLSGLSRERIRQLEKKLSQDQIIEESIGVEINMIANNLTRQIGPVVSAIELDNWITSTFYDKDVDDLESRLARCALKKLLNYECVSGIYIDNAAVKIVKRLKKAAVRLADDVGLIDKEALRNYLPSRWDKFFSALIDCCELHQVSGQLALRDTSKAKVKAALLEIGRAATKEEIASIAGLDSGRISGQLSSITSIARADKTRWGLTEWIDDIYEGIPAEIVQRIKEDGGATTLERLVEELPRLFGVSESSVKAYIDTPQFKLQDGYVSIADYSTLTLRDLNDVIHGRTTNGHPYWTFLVEDRYFDGYSLVGFPAELARELGCRPNDSTQVHVTKPKGCKDLSINWRLASLSGASLGYLSDPLERLGATSGDLVRMIIKNPKGVELCRENTVISESNSAEALLQRIKNRRKVI